MSAAISRRKLSSYVAQSVSNGKKMSAVMQELAAYLVDTGRTRDAELIVRDIESSLAKSGVVVVRTTSARPLNAQIKEEIESLARAEYGTIDRVEIIETIDETVIGGVKIVFPEGQLDSTVRAKLEKLKVV